MEIASESFGDWITFSIVVSSVFCPLGEESAASSIFALCPPLELLVSELAPPPDEPPPDEPPPDILPPDEPPPDMPPPDEPPLDEPPLDEPPPDMPDMPWLDPAEVVPCCPETMPVADPPVGGGSLPRCTEQPLSQNDAAIAATRG